MTLRNNPPPNSSCDNKVSHQGQPLKAAEQRVGYKNPPKHTQFKGSGNPGGRPKKRPPLDFDKRLVDYLEAKLPHSEKLGLDLLLNTLVTQSAKGDVRATKYLFDLYRDAKHRTRHSGIDEEADHQAAERLFASLGSFPFESAAERPPTALDAADE